MRYKPSSKFITNFQNAPRRVVVMLVCSLLFVGYLMFFGPAKSNEPPIGAFLFTVLVVAGIGFVQVRRFRKTAVELAAVSFVLVDEGISVESPSSNHVIPYRDIFAVTIKRRFFSKGIVQILLKSKGGEAALPNLETPESFIIALRQHMGSVPFNEKRSFLV